MRWIIKTQHQTTKEGVIEQILLNRGVKKKDWKNFLKPDFNRDLLSPFKLAGMKEAVRLILQARHKKEKIGIFSDYDADGLPAAALAFKLFQRLNIQTEVYIPRRQDGYGLSRKGIDGLIKKNCRLILALDLGITARAEVEYARKKGLKMIILDHHLVQSDKKPRLRALVNPKQKNCSYPFKDFSAGGLMYKLAQAVAEKTHQISQGELKWWLDLAAISTISDIVPLIGENRVIAKFGLIVLSKTRNLGLRALYQTAGIQPSKITSYSVSFQIAPRLNAPGRLLDPWGAFRLLVTDDKAEAARLAGKLNQINSKRQKEMAEMLQRSIKKIEQEHLDKNKILLVVDKNLKPGVVGLVAGKLMDKYHRPAIVLSQEGKICRGSARSIDNFHLMQALDDCSQLLSRHGGHRRAAGLSLEARQLKNFYDAILRLADQRLTAQDLVPKLEIDAELDFARINLAFHQRLSTLEPFGFGNPRPIFFSRKVKLASFRRVGRNGEHLKLVLEQSNRRLAAIGFNLGARATQLKREAGFDLAFSLDLNDYQGRHNLELKVLDLKPSQPDKAV